MKTCFAFVVFAVSLIQVFSLNERLISGTPLADNNKCDSFVTVRCVFKNGETSSCGGVIQDENTIKVLASCIRYGKNTKEDPASCNIRTGYRDPNGPAEVIEVDGNATQVPNNYSPVIGINNHGIINLSSSINSSEYISPVVSINTDTTLGKNGISGFICGLSNNQTLVVADVAVNDWKTCVGVIGGGLVKKADLCINTSEPVFESSDTGNPVFYNNDVNIFLGLVRIIRAEYPEIALLGDVSKENKKY